jgi:hypothetical protein
MGVGPFFAEGKRNFNSVSRTRLFLCAHVKEGGAVNFLRAHLEVVFEAANQAR